MYPQKFEVNICDTEQSRKAATESLAYCAEIHGAIALDTETTGLPTLENQLVCVTLATPDEAWVFQGKDLQKCEDIVNILQDHKTLKMCHSAPFDWSYMLYRAGIQIPTTSLWDTKKQAQGLEHTGLAKLVLNLLGQKLDKSLAISFQAGIGINANQVLYTGVDALCLWPVRAKLHQIGKHNGGIVYKDMIPITDYLTGHGSWPEHGKYLSVHGCEIPDCTLMAVEQGFCVPHSSMLRKD